MGAPQFANQIFSCTEAIKLKFQGKEAAISS